MIGFRCECGPAIDCTYPKCSAAPKVDDNMDEWQLTLKNKKELDQKLVDENEGFYEKMWKDLVSLQRGDAQLSVKLVLSQMRRIKELEKQLAEHEKKKVFTEAYVARILEREQDCLKQNVTLRKAIGAWDRAEVEDLQSAEAGLLKALASTADLSNCIICDAEPIGRYAGVDAESGAQVVWIDCGIDAGTMFYKVRELK
jgi:hypothetical protein